MEFWSGGLDNTRNRTTLGLAGVDVNAVGSGPSVDTPMPALLICSIVPPTNIPNRFTEPDF